MNKEPIGLYIFRFVVGFGLFAFMCMLYWSSVLVEDNVRNLRADIASLKNDVFALRSETAEIRNEVLRAILRERQQYRVIGKTPPLASVLQDRPHMDPSYPNLLHEDRFYAETLPDLLGEDYRSHGTFHTATYGKPSNLHPFSGWNEVNNWRSMCLVSLARLEFGKYETFAPNMAIKIEARKMKDSDNPEFWVHLRDHVYWQPLSEKLFTGDVKLAPHLLRKHQVTAEDYKFYFDAMMNPYFHMAKAVSLRNYLGDIEEIEIIDKLTFVVRWRTHEVIDDEGDAVQKIKYVAKQLSGSLSPLPSFVYKYFSDGTKIVEDDSDPETYRTNSVWAQNFTEHWAKNIIVSCGGWIFDGMTDREIRFRRNPDHYFPLDVLAEKMVVHIKNTPDASWQDFKSNRLDRFILQPDQLVELDQFQKSDLYKKQETAGNAIKQLDYAMMSYYYIGWNQATPYFKSKKVRQAMTMAIDRNRIIEQYVNGMGIQITGPFSHYSSAYDTTVTPWPFDLERARELLEEEGWYDADGDGIIDKEIDGKRIPFVFNLTYYVKNPTLKSICEYVATALKEIGIRCHLKGVDMADLSATFDGKNFDALCIGWALGTPPEDPRQLWHSEGAKIQGASNAVGFVNAEADAIIDKLTFEADPQKRMALYHRFHRIIFDEQPYTFIYTPKVTLLSREYLQNVFIPADRQDLIPGANVPEPISSIFWIKNRN